MLRNVLRLAPLAAFVLGLALAVPSAAQVGSGKIAYTTGSLGNPREADGLYTVNVDGSDRTLLKSGKGFSFPRWSPDGSRVAFTDYYWEGGWPRYRLLVMDADGSNEHLVAAGTGTIALSRQPWAPDGSRIAWGPFPMAGGDVYTADAAGGDVRQLTFDGASKDPPSWSPTGSTLIYSRRFLEVGREDRWELFVVDADGSGTTQITSSDWGTVNRDPTWAPSGDWVAFTRGSIYVIHPDGTGLRRVASVESGYVEPPTWSPDGTKIAYSIITQTGRYSYKFEIQVVDADGGNLKRLTEFGSRPVWSPDGDRILFFGPGGLMTMNADGRCLVVVNRDGAGEMPSWQPVPGGPSVGRAHCHAASVAGEVAGNDHSAVVIEATVVNEGTEPLTHVTLVATATTDASLTRFPGQGCSIRQLRVTCRLSRLEPGAEHSFLIGGKARRVGLDQESSNLPLRAQLTVGASEHLLRTYKESQELTFALARCTNRDRGAGYIGGTAFADKICGRRGADYIFPVEGNDVVKAGDGNDVIDAVDGRTYRDRISCGRGRDRVIADRRDRVSRDCERVRRRSGYS